MAGGVLSTLNVALGPAVGAGLFDASVAVPAAREMPSVPSPAMFESSTVRVVVPVPDTPIDAVALPVAFKVMLAGESVIEL